MLPLEQLRGVTVMQTIHVGPARWSGTALPVKGGRVVPPPPSRIPRGTSSFEFLFKAILPDLAKFHWNHVPLNNGQGFADENFAAMWALVRNEPLIPPDTMLPEFARYMCEDWCDFCGFEKPPQDADRLDWQDRNGNIRPEVDIAFMNVDSAFWVMHCRDASLCQRVRDHLKQLPGFWVVDAEHAGSGKAS